MKTTRPATPEEIRAYREAVVPHIGNRAAVERVRREHHMQVSYLSKEPRYTIMARSR